MLCPVHGWSTEVLEADYEGLDAQDRAEAEEAEIQAELEQERADSKAHGARLIETYRCMYQVTEEDLADPNWPLFMEEAAKRSAIIGLDQAGYIATTEPEAFFVRDMFGGRTYEYEDEDGNQRTVTVVGAMYGQIKGYKP